MTTTMLSNYGLSFRLGYSKIEDRWTLKFLTLTTIFESRIPKNGADKSKP
jgi:hypothetical protein